ncbi:IS3 family transposase [Mycoplasmopsis verecunda]|nr:IS3 family transposase [Mycoplasmopsis verecunda]WPB54454.1 IS3 family transposase [Mycoplasmopsis verecunda]
MQVASIPKSTYEYQVNAIHKMEEKLKELYAVMNEIFTNSNQTYGYRRMQIELKNRGYFFNRKKVRKLMKRCVFKVEQKSKRKYSSYKGEIGKVAENLINRNFLASLPLQKLYTDITEFKLKTDVKLYFSAIVDGFNSEIVSWAISASPNLQLIKNTLEPLLPKLKGMKGSIMHSDQGWHYQHKYFIETLKKHNITQSMSRKGNSPDNGLVESCFGVIKTEFFYPNRKRFDSIEQFISELNGYIWYYNNKRIKLRLKSNPVDYRNSFDSNLVQL